MPKLRIFLCLRSPGVAWATKRGRALPAVTASSPNRLAGRIFWRKWRPSLGTVIWAARSISESQGICVGTYDHNVAARRHLGWSKPSSKRATEDKGGYNPTGVHWFFPSYDYGPLTLILAEASKG